MITLASDFPSPYPAAMRGVICSRTDARIEEIAHDFPRQDVSATAFWLREVVPYFPPATHCAVVDPGVGTDRGAVVVEAGAHRIVAPDNGLVIPTARRLDGEFDVWTVEYDDDEMASSTFHGRDLFAPTAAAVHDAERVADLDDCVPADQWVDLRFPDPEVSESGATGEVLVVDGFGNVITNVPGEVLEGRDEVTVDGERTPVRAAYAELDAGERLATVGSHGNVELAVNRGRGDDAFDLDAGDGVALDWTVTTE